MQATEKPSATPDRHLGAPFTLRLPVAMLDVLDQFAEQNDRKRTAEITRAVREYLERAGLWPPKPDDAAD